MTKSEAVAAAKAAYEVCEALGREMQVKATAYRKARGRWTKARRVWQDLELLVEEKRVEAEAKAKGGVSEGA